MLLGRVHLRFLVVLDDFQCKRKGYIKNIFNICINNYGIYIYSKCKYRSAQFSKGRRSVKRVHFRVHIMVYFYVLRWYVIKLRRYWLSNRGYNKIVTYYINFYTVVSYFISTFLVKCYGKVIH